MDQLKHELSPELWGLDPETVRRNLEIANSVLNGYKLRGVAEAAGLSIARVRQITLKLCRLGRPDLYEEALEKRKSQLPKTLTVEMGRIPKLTPALADLKEHKDDFIESFPWSTYSTTG